jgi:hypothetical protein
MDFFEAYFAKQGFQPEITERPHPDLNTCIVIPCINETILLRSMQSLWDCVRPIHAVEVVVVINSPENCDKNILERNRLTIQEASDWTLSHIDPLVKFFIMHRSNLPKKFAGVGLARKLGMDEAASRLHMVQNPSGIITGFDADSICDTNYLVEIERHFRVHKETPGASIYFEHPVAGDEFDEAVYIGIILYELHLRYLNQALRYAKHPHAYHTVGSSFAVRASSYVKQGGMNRQKAGEDFYFLQKIIALGNFTEINKTRVIPSPRESDRVPFGTGASMRRWNSEKHIDTYNLGAFEDIRKFIGYVDCFYKAQPNEVTPLLSLLSKPLQDFLQRINVQAELKSISGNCASLATFRNRFFHWFNAFRVIKYLNFSHETYYEKSEVVGEAQKLLQQLGYKSTTSEPAAQLQYYRELDKTGHGLT